MKSMENELNTEVGMTITEIIEWSEQPREDLIRIYPIYFIRDVYKILFKTEPEEDWLPEKILGEISYQVNVIKQNPYRLDAHKAKAVYDKVDNSLSIARMGMLDPIANPEFIKDKELNLKYIFESIKKLEEDLEEIKVDMIELHADTDEDTDEPQPEEEEEGED